MDRRRDDGGFLGQPAWLWTFAALLLGLGMTAITTRMHHNALAQAESAQAARLAERSFDAVESQLRSCGLLVRSVQALFLASQEVTPDEFETIYTNLRPREHFPSLQAIGVAHRELRADGEHFVTDLVTPRDGNQRLYGLDIASQPANMRALEYSRDKDEPAMSGAFELIQRTGLPGPKDGVIIRLPVFSPGPSPTTIATRRARLVGSLAVSFQVSSLIERALPRETREDFAVRITDVSDQAPHLLFASDTAAETSALPDALTYRYRRDIVYGGRIWRMELRGTPGQMQSMSLPALTFAIGVLASLLLATLAWSLANTRARAFRMARNLSAQYRDSEARFRALNELLPTLVLLAHSQDGGLTYANHAARERLQLPDPEQSGKTLADLFEDEDLQEQFDDIAKGGWAMINRPTRFRSSGRRAYWMTLSVSQITLEGQSHLLAVANDITELRELNEMLAYQASHDALTGLSNRREFVRRLDAAINDLVDGTQVAMLYLDIDQFKVVNDTSGHVAGDQLLAQLANLLSSHLIEGEAIARLGGDEFGILVERTTPAAALAFAERMRHEIEVFEFSWEERAYTVSASIGLVLIDHAGAQQREVYSLADTACYMAKERGRNRVQLYSEDDQEIVRRRSELQWIGRLRQALSEQRFCLYFQELHPLQVVADAGGAHIELLIRLRDERGVMVPPGDFIPAAERYGLMPQLDRWVVETAFANFARLHPSGEPVRLCAINLSALTIEDDTFPAFVIEKLQTHGVAAERICFEITETAAVASMARVIAMMNRLRDIGCHFSLDDFGAGMASFGYLKNFPIDYIKIDGSFVRNIETDAVSQSIVRAVTDIGHQLGLIVVAEWVADQRAYDLLKTFGVDYAQGYLLHRPQALLR